jgi:hypothetical protein
MSLTRCREHWLKNTLYNSTVFDNSGSSVVRVPGSHSVPFRRELPPHRRFAHGFSDWSQDRILLREIMMLYMMNRITDNPDWHTKIFSDNPKDQFDIDPRDFENGFLVNDSVWEWCVKELRDKARDYRKTKRIRVFDSASCISKSDLLVSTELLAELRQGTQGLLITNPPRATVPPIFRGPIFDNIDPCLYPLVYGQTVVLRRGTFGNPNDNFFSCFGSHENAAVAEASTTAKHILEDLEDRRKGCWSKEFQMIPCEVSFRGEPSTTDVRITSYINNLHPVIHRHMYRTIEKALSLAIPLWNDVLMKPMEGLVSPRIKTFGVEYEFGTYESNELISR